MREVFLRIIIVVAENTSFDLQNIISYPIIAYTLLFAHCDGAHVKTNKSALIKKLESFQTETIAEVQLPRSYVQVYDGAFFSTPSSQK